MENPLPEKSNDIIDTRETHGKPLLPGKKRNAADLPDFDTSPKDNGWWMRRRSCFPESATAIKSLAQHEVARPEKAHAFLYFG